MLQVLSLVIITTKGADMKRISVQIVATYTALFEDFILWGQTEPCEAERDISRIVTLCETRGERSIFIDFPSCAKSLDNALSRGSLNQQDFHILGSRNGLPAFMNSFWMKVFSSEGILLHEPDIGAVKALRQVLLLFKKIQIPCTEERIRDEVSSFFTLDASLRPVSESWHSLDFSSERCLDDEVAVSDHGTADLFGQQFAPTSILRLAQRVADCIVRRFHDFDPDALIGNHGPGAVADLERGVDKYVFPTWNQQLERVFPRDLHAAANLRVYDYDGWLEAGNPGTLRTLPAKLIPVNKTQEKPRLIASEPTANQFVMGGIRKWIRRQIDAGTLSDSVNIRDQSLSRDLALRASKDNSIATVDLSNASDRLTCWTVERVFRKAPRLLEALAATRSYYIYDPRYTGTYATLRKYAPQGNATVFPIQSITYALFAIAAVIRSTPGMYGGSNDALLHSAIKRAVAMVRVYGDDIILPTRALPDLSSLLEFCQLKVNGAKSHYSGKFAESCGMDAFDGTDVTPVYIASIDDTAKPGNVQSLVDVSNACYMAGLFNLGNQVAERIPNKFRKDMLVTHYPGSALSLHTYSSGFNATRIRHNRDLHRDEYLVLSLSTKVVLTKRDSWESLLQYFVEDPAPDTKWSSSAGRRVKAKLALKWEPLPAVTSR